MDLLKFEADTTTHDAQVEPPPAKKRKGSKDINVDAIIEELSNSVTQDRRTRPTKSGDFSCKPCSKKENIEECKKALAAADKYILDVTKRTLYVVFVYGSYLLYLQTLLQNTSGGSFNGWMDKNTKMRHSQGRAYMKFYRTFHNYPKVTRSTLPFNWFKGNMEIIREYFEAHPDVATKWR